MGVHLNVHRNPPHPSQTTLYTRLTCAVTQKLDGTLENVLFPTIQKFSQVIPSLPLPFFSFCHRKVHSRSPSSLSPLRHLPLHLHQNNAFLPTAPTIIPIDMHVYNTHSHGSHRALSHSTALHTHAHAYCVLGVCSNAQIAPPLLLPAANLLRNCLVGR